MGLGWGDKLLIAGRGHWRGRFLTFTRVVISRFGGIAIGATFGMDLTNTIGA